MAGNKDSIAVLGAKGMLGTELVKVFGNAGRGVNAFDLPEFDITDSEQLRQVVESSRTIINCAAYTNVEKAESETERAFSVNAEAVGKLAQLAKKAGAQICHISTDFVFDGSSDRPYLETDQVNPINAYGRSKLAGEKLFCQSGVDGCIIRIQWTYGNGGNNFIKKIIEIARQNRSLKVVDDQVGSCTATTQIATAILDLLSNNASLPNGIFHYAASGFASRYDVAKFIFDKLEIDVELSRCKTSDYKSDIFRPLNSRFNCDKIQKLLMEPIKGWQEPLERFLEQL